MQKISSFYQFTLLRYSLKSVQSSMNYEATPIFDDNYQKTDIPNRFMKKLGEKIKSECLIMQTMSNNTTMVGWWKKI